MIRYPKMHVAQSTANRIINIANGIDSTVVQPSAPVLPDPMAQSEELTAAMKTPPGAMQAPEGAEATSVEASLTGGDPLSALVSQSLKPTPSA